MFNFWLLHSFYYEDHLTIIGMTLSAMVFFYNPSFWSKPLIKIFGDYLSCRFFMFLFVLLFSSLISAYVGTSFLRSFADSWAVIAHQTIINSREFSAAADHRCEKQHLDYTFCQKDAKRRRMLISQYRRQLLTGQYRVTLIERTRELETQLKTTGFYQQPENYRLWQSPFEQTY